MAGYIGSKAVSVNTTSATITGDASIGGDLSLGDNDKIILGAGSDLQIYHSGSHSFIDDTGTGTLRIRGSDIQLEKYTGENMLVANSDGAVTFYHDGAAKLATSATGVAITGGVAIGGTGTANTLDDYEEGTWTPSHGGNTSYSARTGTYVKVGKKVFIRGQVHINALGTGSNAAITGLPFTSATTVNGNPAGTLNVNYYANLAIAVIHIAGYVTSNATTINTVANVTANASIQYNTGAFYQNNSRIDFSMTYETA